MDSRFEMCFAIEDEEPRGIIYAENHIGWQGKETVYDAEHNGLNVRIGKIGNWDVTITGSGLNGRVVRDGFPTLTAAQEWVSRFMDIAATTPITQSRYFVPDNP